MPVLATVVDLDQADRSGRYDAELCLGDAVPDELARTMRYGLVRASAVAIAAIAIRF